MSVSIAVVSVIASFEEIQNIFWMVLMSVDNSIENIEVGVAYELEEIITLKAVMLR